MIIFCDEQGAACPVFISIMKKIAKRAWRGFNEDRQFVSTGDGDFFRGQ